MKDDYAKLLGLRKKLFHQFRADQESAANSIVSLIIDDIRSHMITTLLDVGCGTGEILHFAAQRLQKAECRGVRYVGVDHCLVEIRQARKAWTRGEFVCLGAEELGKLDDKLKEQEKGPIDWGKTLVLCVGHTLPHFTNLDTFVECLKGKDTPPPLLLVDFYHSWDDTVKWLRENPGQSRFDLKAITEQYEVFLVTSARDDKNHVNRGIAIRRRKAKSMEPKPRFGTTQLFESSNNLIKRLENAGYIQESTVRYYAGYGRMKGKLLSLASPVADALNATYRALVSRLVAKIFAKDEKHKHIDNAMKVFGTRVVAVVLPFDIRKTFAQYVSIVPGVVAPERLMQVQRSVHRLPNYPTAHGLYMTLLAQVSSSTAVPLPRVDAAGEISRTDENFEKVAERPFFRRSTIGKVPSGHSYFVVPFYHAKLPLFCVVLNFTKELPIETTDQEVYVAILQSFARLVDQEIKSAFKSEVLQPFYDLALTGLARKGLSRESSIRAIDDAIAHAQMKPWKSWLLTMPSREIAGLATVREECRELEKLQMEARDNALADVLSRIADWFVEGQFFREAGRNRNPHTTCTDVHLERLKNMLSIAKCPTANDITTSWHFGDPELIKSELSWLKKQVITIQKKGKGDVVSGPVADAFRKLKSVFSRDKTNAAFRFSYNRILSLCEIYVGGDSRVKYIPPACHEPNPVVLSDDPTPGLIRVVENLATGFPGFIEKIQLEIQPLGEECLPGSSAVKSFYRFYKYTLSIVLSRGFQPQRSIGLSGQMLDAALKDVADRTINEACQDVSGGRVDGSIKVLSLSFTIKAEEEEGEKSTDWVRAEIQQPSSGRAVEVTLS